MKQKSESYILHYSPVITTCRKASKTERNESFFWGLIFFITYDCLSAKLVGYLDISLIALQLNTDFKYKQV